MLEENTFLNVPCGADLKQRLLEIAKIEDRSLSAQVRIFLDAAVKQYDDSK